MAGISSSLTTVPVTDIKISNLTIPLANTEVAFTLSASSKGFEIAARGNSRLKIAFVMGDTSLVYKTVPRSSSWELTGFNFVNKLMYIQSDIPGEIVEIVELI